MKHLTDEQVLEGVKKSYEMAKGAPKEGPGTGRPPGAAGRIANEWLMWVKEAKRRDIYKGGNQ